LGANYRGGPGTPGQAPGAMPPGQITRTGTGTLPGDIGARTGMEVLNYGRSSRPVNVGGQTLAPRESPMDTFNQFGITDPAERQRLLRIWGYA